jgi:hypothetical protein
MTILSAAPRATMTSTQAPVRQATLVAGFLTVTAFPAESPTVMPSDSHSGAVAVQTIT